MNQNKYHSSWLASRKALCNSAARCIRAVCSRPARSCTQINMGCGGSKPIVASSYRETKPQEQEVPQGNGHTKAAGESVWLGATHRN